MKLTDAQWSFIEPLLPKAEPREDGKGRPRRDPRQVLDGILWILKTGAQWSELPRPYPPYQTCHRWFQQWSEDGTIERVLEALAKDLQERGGLDLKEVFIDGSFAAAKKGGFALGQPNAARAPRSWQLRTSAVFLSPLGLKVLRRMK
jgi:transposase